MNRLLGSKGRHAGEPVPEEDVFGRHLGRHCRRRFRAYSPQAVAVDAFSRVRTPPALAPFPLAADELIPFPAPAYRRPYDSPKDAA